MLAAKPAVAEERASVAVSEVAEHVGLDKSAGSRRVRDALGAGFLQNLERRGGRPAQLVLGESLPERLELLPLPERLKEDAPK